MEFSPNNIKALAYYDEVGDAQCFYLPEFPIQFQELQLPNLDDILAEFCAGVFAHEDFHQAIVNIGIDTLAGQEHDLMEKVVEWLNKY